MKVKPGYKRGDIVKFNSKFWNNNFSTNDETISRFRGFNLYRRKNGLNEIHPLDSSFMVMVINSGDVHQTYRDGSQKSLLDEQFIELSPLIDNPCYQQLYQFVDKGMISLPAYLFEPSDKTNYDLMARYISLVNSCPYCDKKVEGHIIYNHSYFICHKNIDKHRYYYRTNFSLTGDGYVRFNLGDHCVEWESSNNMYKMDGYVTNNIKPNKIYENMIEIMNKWKVWF